MRKIIGHFLSLIHNYFQTKGESNMLKGIDISHHNGTVDFEKVKAAGVTFVYIKATEGVTYRDPMYQPNALNSMKAGLPVGFYHFARPGINDPKDEAKNFVEAISVFKYTLLPVLDLEVNPKGLSGDELYAWANTFISEVKTKTGHDVMLYTYLNYLNEYPALQKLNNIPLWIAVYRNEAPTVSGWKNWTVWQYSDKETIPGVEGGVDADYVQDLNNILINKPKPVENPTNPIPQFKRILKLTSPMMRGDDVKLVQKRLAVKPVDGIYGPATEQAVKQFQKLHGLKVDGIVGPLTWKALFNANSSSNTKSVQPQPAKNVNNDLHCPDCQKPICDCGPEKPRLLRVIADQLWVYNKPDWNAKYQIVKKGDTFTITHRYKVGNDYMYQLKSGLYITANPKYVKLLD